MLDLTDEEWAIVQAVVDASPPLTAEQLSRLSLILGLVPIERLEL